MEEQSRKSKARSFLSILSVELLEYPNVENSRIWTIGGDCLAKISGKAREIHHGIDDIRIPLKMRARKPESHRITGIQYLNDPDFKEEYLQYQARNDAASDKQAYSNRQC